MNISTCNLSDKWRKKFDLTVTITIDECARLWLQWFALLLITTITVDMNQFLVFVQTVFWADQILFTSFCKTQISQDFEKVMHVRAEVSRPNFPLAQSPANEGIARKFPGQQKDNISTESWPLPCLRSGKSRLASNQVFRVHTHKALNDLTLNFPSCFLIKSSTMNDPWAKFGTQSHPSCISNQFPHS